MAQLASTPRIGMIWAEALNHAIGRAGVMPWHLPEDLAHFRRVTTGAPVIMGRRTWESLPARFRPLPGRLNIVITRNPNYSAPGAKLCGSLAEAVELAGVLSADAAVGDAASAAGSAGRERVAAWVIGGGELYRAALPIAQEVWRTRIEVLVADADTYAPQLDEHWHRVEETAPQVSESGLQFSFERWERVAA